MSAAENPEFYVELFAGFGPVSVRRMFSGVGIFADGMMIALVGNGVIYLKADERTIPAFEAEGLSPFSYATKDGRRTINSYWKMPERLYDDPDELAQWARQARDAASRTHVKKPSGKPRARSKSAPKRKAKPKKAKAAKSKRRLVKKRR